jgi:hypothetical protein
MHLAMIPRMKRVVLVILLGTSLGVAKDEGSIRVCIGPLENRSSYQLPVDKLKADVASQLSHKQVKAIIINDDISAEMAKNKCDYLLLGEFSNVVSLKPGETADIGGIVVDDRKRFALRFRFELRRNVGEKPVYSDQISVIDKNPKTCADDQIYEAVRSIREYLKTG